MKKIFLYTGILLGIGYLSSKAKEVYDNFSLGFEIKKLQFLEANATGLAIAFLADILVFNNTGVPIYAPVKITNIEFYLYGKKIGDAKIYKDGLFIQPGKPLLLQDVRIDIIFKDYSYLYNAFINMQQTALEYKVNYEIAGNEFSYSGVYNA